MSNSAIDNLLTRRSVLANNLGEPGPDDAQLERMLTVASRVPDHKKLCPWRFVVFKGDARGAFGEVLAQACRAAEPSVGDVRLETEAQRFLRAPVVVAVISSLVENPVVPEWEQVLSAGAACQNLLHAATALGFAGQWITEWYAYDPMVQRALDLRPGERIAGFVYIGTAREQPTERDRPALEDIVSNWQPRR